MCHALDRPSDPDAGDRPNPELSECIPETIDLEGSAVRIACERLDEADTEALEELLRRQEEAVAARDPLGFHALDDQFHREICERSGLEFAWEVIRENKAHIDRVRFLSLAFASQDAFRDHVRILDAIKDQDAERAMTAMREHLSRIRLQIVRIREEHPTYFTNEQFDL